MSSLCTSASAQLVNEGFPGNFLFSNYLFLSNWKIYSISVKLKDKVYFYSYNTSYY